MKDKLLQRFLRGQKVEGLAVTMAQYLLSECDRSEPKLTLQDKMDVCKKASEKILTYRTLKEGEDVDKKS